MKRYYNCISVIMLICFFGFTKYGVSQNEKHADIKKIKELINRKEIDSSQAELKKQIDYFKSVKQYDSLINYYDFVGSLTLANNDKQIVIDRTERFTSELLELNNPNISAYAKIGLASIYYQVNDTKKAYEVALEAYPFLEQVKIKKGVLKANLEYDLGFYALKSTNYPQAKSHFSKAIKILNKADSLDYVLLQKTYNNIGMVNWTQSQMDSTKYYLEKSLFALNKSPKGEDFMNEFYRPAILKMNLALVSQAIGKNYEAISFSEKSIQNFQSFLDNSLDESRKNNAKKTQLAGIDNLGVFYAEIGEFKRAEELINYSYNIKKKLFDEDDSNIVISKIILAEAKINNQDLEGSAKLLDEAITSLEKNPSAQLYWKGAAYMVRAYVFNDLGEFENAAKYYDIGYKINKEITGNTHSKETLEELGNMAVFFAKQGQEKKALALANEAYNYTKKSSFKNSIRDFYSTTNLAETYFYLKKFEDAKNISEEALNLKIKTENNSIKISDSIALQFEKPRAITINCKSKYELESNKTKSFLLDLLKQVEAGIAILDQRKTVIKSHSDLSNLLSHNTELFNFSKQLRLELYRLTNDMNYIEKLVVSHESGMYSRIRSRLNIREHMKFFDIPNAILEREQKLKTNITTALQSEKETIDPFFKASKQWNTFLDSLKIKHPRYYKMRYATIEKSLDNLKNSVSDNTTIIRYLFVNDDLFAFVINSNKQTFHKLETDNLTKKIDDVTQSVFNTENTKKTLHLLYNQLWKSFENEITTDKIIIIPDQELFNLSFETLTPTLIDSFNDLANSCLLSKYIISYNYSLYLLDEGKKTINFSDDFIAFAPEFNDEMKKNYKITISDSINVDNAYLTLLPQPFTADLVKEYSKLFNGSSFINENASKQIFTKEANEHKIIHIGTHAESNNVSPELSRLIFAKNLNDSIYSQDNSLYTYEIYNQNLASNLAILTACETGKPTYQAGEGMISLAHAFNYAGSESILTSLWKIDEQSSAKIIEYFYGYIKKGLPKDEALQKAKLDYITTANGRTNAPQYWAGLVLIGDTSPIALNNSSNLVFWIVTVTVLLILIGVIARRKKRKV
nr:CHAT domain-containing tetratricopeptide repeat protein [uncultured Psychroserpens sp.]